MSQKDGSDLHTGTTDVLEAPRKPKKKRKKKDDTKSPEHKFSVESQNGVFDSKQNEVREYSTYSSDKVSATELIAAGFRFVEEDGGSVMCADCGLRLSASFQQHFDPLAVHQLHSQGRCSFLRSLQKRAEQRTGPITNDDLTEGNAATSVAQSETDLLTVTGSRDDEIDDSEIHDTRRLYPKLYNINAQSKLAELSRLKKVPNRDMKFEIVRRQTFTQSLNCRNIFTQVEVNNLAAQGIYLKSSDAGSEVASCAFCEFSLKLLDNVLHNRNVLSLHETQSPSCPLVTGIVSHLRQHVNVPDVLNPANWDADLATMSADRSYLGINSQMAKYSEMGVIERRRETFLTFPHDAFRGDINLLCEAGYFFQGEAAGSVTCFWCGCDSANWKVGENPWQRHTRTSPSCQFVIQYKGEEYVRSVLEEHRPYRAKAKEDKITNVTPRMLRPRWDSQAVQKALDMGLDKTAVKTVITNRIKRGDPDLKYIAEIVREVSDLPVPEQMLSAATESPWLPVLIQEPVATNQREEESMVEIDVANEREEDIPSETSSTNEQNDGVAETSGGENCENPRQGSRQMISQLTCKICLAAIVGVIFLPCGHLVCCVSCAAAMVDCPLCRQSIKGTVRANFANNYAALGTASITTS